MPALRTLTLAVLLPGIAAGSGLAASSGPAGPPGSVTQSGAAAAPASAAAPAPPVLLGQRTAEAAGVHVGDLVRVSRDPGLRKASVMRVAGIIPVKADPVDIGRGTRYVKLHFDDYARLAGRDDDVDEVILKARSPAEAPALRDNLNALGTSFHAYTSEELAQRSSGAFEVISRFHEAISVITLAAGAVFLLAILLFKAEERRRELGALRLIGIRRRSLVAFLCAEAAAIAVAGSLIGLALGCVGSAAVNAYFQHYYQTSLVFAAVTPAVAWSSLALGVGFGLAAGVLVALRVARISALELLGR